MKHAPIHAWAIMSACGGIRLNTAYVRAEDMIMDDPLITEALGKDAGLDKRLRWLFYSGAHIVSVMLEVTS